jgi:YggT family protein
MTLFLRTFLSILVFALWLAILGRVILSWVDPQRRYAISGILFQITEPILAPVRRVIPPAGMLDLSAFIVLIALSTLMRVLAF